MRILGKGKVSRFPCPKKLSKSQRDWLKHEHSEALLGSIIYHLLSDPVRSTSLLASMNSASLDINQALYLQEETTNESKVDLSESDSFTEATAESSDMEILDDDLSTFNWESAKQIQPQIEEEENEKKENNLDDLLGDFLASMNK